MDFKIQNPPAGGLSKLAVDALLIVMVGKTVPTELDKELTALLRDAVKQGDFEFKAARCLYVHRPAGVKAARLAFVCAGDDSAKAFKAAVASGLAQLKALGVTGLAVAGAGGDALTAGHAEAMVTAASDAVYLYRHTKPSAPAAPKLAKVSLVAAKAQAKALEEGLRRGQAVAAGVNVARECANRPGNHATPSHLASEAKNLGKQFGFKVLIRYQQ